MKGIKEANQLKPDFILAKTYTELLKNLNDYAKLHGITRRYEEMVNDIYFGFATPFVIEYEPLFKIVNNDRATEGLEIKETNKIVKRRALKKKRIIGNIIAEYSGLFRKYPAGIDTILAELISHFLTNLNDEIFDDGMAKEYEDVTDDIYYGFADKFISKKNFDEWERALAIKPDKTNKKEKQTKTILKRSLLKRHVIADIIAGNGWLHRKLRPGIRELIAEAKQDTERKNYLEEIAEFVAKWVSQDMDMIIVFSGTEGFGKSAASYHFGSLISKYTQIKFGIDNFVWKGDDMIEKIRNYPKMSVIIFDEAITAMYKMESTSGLNIMVKKVLTVCRERNMIIIFNIPNLFDIDKFARERRVKMWFDVNAELKGFEIIRGKMELRSNLKSPTFGGTPYWKPEGNLKFKDFPKGFKSHYKELKENTSFDAILDKGNAAKTNGGTKRDEMRRYLIQKYKEKDSELLLSDNKKCENKKWDKHEFKALKRKMGFTKNK